MEDNQIINVKNLTKIYPSKTEAVSDISFSVKKGEFFGFLGPNGAGKTTTMRILATLLFPTSGEVSVNGFELGKRDDQIRCSIGFALQGITLDLTASAWENLILIGVLYEMTRVEAKKRAEELLTLFGLDKVADSWVKNYSGGMRKRLDLAIALMHEPAILFLDEPTEGLDPVARRKVWNYLKELNQNGTTIFLTTHYMQEADFLCERISIIDQGKIMVTDSPANLKKKIGGDLDDVFIHYTGHDIQEEQLDLKAPDPYVRQ